MIFIQKSLYSKFFRAFLKICTPTSEILTRAMQRAAWGLGWHWCPCELQQSWAWQNLKMYWKTNTGKKKIWKSTDVYGSCLLSTTDHTAHLGCMASAGLQVTPMDFSRFSNFFFPVLVSQYTFRFCHAQLCCNSQGYQSHSRHQCSTATLWNYSTVITLLSTIF